LEGLRCPICKAISQVDAVKDGEMFTCPFCNYRYTVTEVRRYFLHPQIKSIENIGLAKLEDSLKDLEYHQLIEIIQSVLKEISRRFARKQEYMARTKSSYGRKKDDFVEINNETYIIKK